MVADSGGSGAASIIEESGSGFALNVCGHLLGRLGALTSMAWAWRGRLGALALRSLCLVAWAWCGRFAVMELERWRVGSLYGSYTRPRTPVRQKGLLKPASL